MSSRLFMTSKFSLLKIAVVLQALCWVLIMSELVGRLKGNNFYSATLLISSYGEKKILPRTEWGLFDMREIWELFIEKSLKPLD